MQTLCLKYRLFPTKGQEQKLTDTLETCRQVYNSLLNDRKCQYEMHGSSPSRYDQQKMFPQWSKLFPEIGNVHSQVLQNVAVRVDIAFRAFFRRVHLGETPGFPRFKGDGYDSFCYPQSGFRVGDSTVSLSLFGRQEKIKVKLHRPVTGKIKTCCVHRIGFKWFVCFSAIQEYTPLPHSNETVGIDMGLKTFASLSGGTFIENPRFFRADEKVLAKAQRKLTKQPRRSWKRRKAKKVISRIYERIRNRRHDFVHQTARRLVNRFGVIAVEKLNVKGMVKNRYLAKSISDASWSMFRAILTQKAESAARVVIAVDPAYTSQDCHACGYRAKKKLSERWHLCPTCGASLDRDTNAALNILQTALGQQCVREVGRSPSL